jgi:cell division septum initiation protein DivIVA
MADHKSELIGDIVALEAAVEQLQHRVTDLEAENERLRDRVAELDARTDLLQLVSDVDNMTAEQRSIAILQHMHRKCKRRDAPRVALTRDQVEQCLHHPPLDRSTFYCDMRRCVRLVDDESVCWYASNGVGSRDDAAVVLDLEGGELPERYQARGES